MNKNSNMILSVEEYSILYEQGHNNVNISKCLPFSDAMPALCYSHGISWTKLIEAFPEPFSFDLWYNSVRGIDWPLVEKFKAKDFDGIKPEILKEINDEHRWDWKNILNQNNWIGKNDNTHEYTIYDQMKFVQEKFTRKPKGVFEIGGGRGVLGNSFGYLGIHYLGVDVASNIKKLYDQSARLFFEKKESLVQVRQGCISQHIESIDWSCFDTIIMVESLEHIPKERFDIFWNKVKTNFKGLFIIVNWLDLHPIIETDVYHCRLVDDELYDTFCNESKRCVYRNLSHLVIEF
jgi:hypothetical protein